jgi:hypothetical protein
MVTLHDTKHQIALPPEIELYLIIMSYQKFCSVFGGNLIKHQEQGITEIRTPQAFCVR